MLSGAHTLGLWLAQMMWFRRYLCYWLLVLGRELYICIFHFSFLWSSASKSTSHLGAMQWDDPFLGTVLGTWWWGHRMLPAIYPWHRMVWLQPHWGKLTHCIWKDLGFEYIYPCSLSLKILCQAVCIHLLLWHRRRDPDTSNHCSCRWGRKCSHKGCWG